MSGINIDKYNALLNTNFIKELGKVSKVVGLTVEAIGPRARLNDLCTITSKDGAYQVLAEVVGFRDNRILLMPFDHIEGIGLGAMYKLKGQSRASGFGFFDPVIGVSSDLGYFSDKSFIYSLGNRDINSPPCH